MRRMRRLLMSGLMVMALLTSVAGIALAGQPDNRGLIWLDGVQVRTLLPPSATPKEGTDPFYKVPGTGGVAAVGPGSAGYHGGHWKVYLVTWIHPPLPPFPMLTSVTAILSAEAAGDITILPAPDQDFLCPIQP